MYNEDINCEDVAGHVFVFFKQKTAYEMLRSLVGSEMCIRDRLTTPQRSAKLGRNLVAKLNQVHYQPRSLDALIIQGGKSNRFDSGAWNRIWRPEQWGNS